MPAATKLLPAGSSSSRVPGDGVRSHRTKSARAHSATRPAPMRNQRRPRRRGGAATGLSGSVVLASTLGLRATGGCAVERRGYARGDWRSTVGFLGGSGRPDWLTDCGPVPAHTCDPPRQVAHGVIRQLEPRGERLLVRGDRGDVYLLAAQTLLPYLQLSAGAVTDAHFDGSALVTASSHLRRWQLPQHLQVVRLETPPGNGDPTVRQERQSRPLHRAKGGLS